MISSRYEALLRLGLKGNPTEEEIHRAYRSLLKEIHPDEGREDGMIYEINEAYDYLCRHKEIKSVKIVGDPVFSQDKRRSETRQEHKRKEAMRRQKELDRLIAEADARKKKRSEAEKQNRSIMNAMKTIRAVLAARVIEDYIDKNNENK